MAKITINDFAKKAYKKYIAAGMTPEGACGLMGNQYAESAGFIANRVEFLCLKRLKEHGKVYTDETYTAAVDSGKISKAEFLNPLPGKQYGFSLSQWTTPKRKSGLYEATVEKGKSIADEDAVLQYVIDELKASFPKTFDILKTTKSVKFASDYVLIHYECPADTGTSIKNIRADYSQQYYDYFVKQKGSDKVDAINALIAVAENEINYLEKASNSKLDDKTANAGSANYTKYWRDVYPQYQGQPWCACFISWCFMKTFGKDVATKLLKHWPYTYCPTMATLFKLNANPKVGDVVIFYRSGEFKHTGLVVSVSGDKFWTIEGNASGASGITPNGGAVVKKSYYNSQLPGTKFCTPDYSIVTQTNAPSSSTSNNSSSSTSSSGTSSSTSTLLRKGSKGQAVKELQEKLNKLGYGLTVDGDFGSKTESAVISFQKKYKLKIDGIVGNETRNALDSAIKTLTAKPTQPSSSASTSWVGEVNVSVGSTLAVRTWAGTEYPKIKSYPELGRGNRVRVLGSLKAIDGSTWYKIAINNAATNNKDIIGFVCGKYIKKVS